MVITFKLIPYLFKSLDLLSIGLSWGMVQEQGPRVSMAYKSNALISWQRRTERGTWVLTWLNIKTLGLSSCLDLRVVSSSLVLGSTLCVEPPYKKKKKRIENGKPVNGQWLLKFIHTSLVKANHGVPDKGRPVQI